MTATSTLKNIKTENKCMMNTGINSRKSLMKMKTTADLFPRRALPAVAILVAVEMEGGGGPVPLSPAWWSQCPKMYLVAGGHVLGMMLWAPSSLGPSDHLP